MRTMGIGVMVLLTAAAAAAQTPVFRMASRFTLPGSVTDTFYLGVLISADIGSLDGPPDGITDLIAANSNQLAPVKFGNGTGGFINGPNVQLKTIPSAIVLANFDDDPAPDLLVGDARTVRLLRGNGDGSFQTPGTEIPAGKGPAAILATDLNADQKMDAIVVDDADQLPGASGNILVLLGQGDGTFVTPGATFPAHVGSTAGVLGDFNRDGKADVAVANSGSGDVSVFFGDGAGNFTVGPTLLAGSAPVAIAAADLNGDAQTDLIVVNQNSDTISVLDGRTGGTFATARPFTCGSSGSSPVALTVADVNLDDHIDVVVANSRSNDASVLLGDGHGNFSPPRAFVSDQEPQAVATGDFNRDSIPDVVTVNRGSVTPNFGVLYGIGDGALVGVEDVVTSPGPTGLAVTDVNNDGLADFIVSHLPTQQSATGSAMVFRADATTGFAPPIELPAAGDAIAVAAGDFNADGYSDAAIVNKSNSSISVYLGSATSGFGAVHNFPVGNGATAVVAADWNRDGRTDLAVARQTSGSNGSVDILLAAANGSLGVPTTVPVGSSPVALDVGDFNKDGNRDLVVANSVSNDVSVLMGIGNGTFQAAVSIASAGGPRAVAVADFDRDGADDFAVARSINSNVSLFYGDGAGGFTPGAQLGVGGSASALVARDVTGDAFPDILVTDQVSNFVSAFYGTGTTRQFRHDSRFDDISVSRGPIAAGSADVDGDGRYDGLAANGFLAGSVSVITNIGGTPVLRGDGNGDQRVSVADALAVIRELGDGNARRVEDIRVSGGTYIASLGIDANGDGFVTQQDALAVTHELFPGL